MNITCCRSLRAQKCFAVHILFFPASLIFESVQGEQITWSKNTLGGFHGLAREVCARNTALHPWGCPGKQQL